MDVLFQNLEKNHSAGASAVVDDGEEILRKPFDRSLI
jgi:hypothetical protein